MLDAADGGEDPSLPGEAAATAPAGGFSLKACCFAAAAAAPAGELAPPPHPSPERPSPFRRGVPTPTSSGRRAAALLLPSMEVAPVSLLPLSSALPLLPSEAAPNAGTAAA